MIAGRYELVREIGRGGMGAVWLARDDVLGRHVAIKRSGMAPGTATPDQERAEREARLAARLSHTHVVAVFDLVHETDQQWLVMEYVDGVNLSKLVERDGALPPDRAAMLMAQAADALAAAHDAGIVHRDVKPSNLLVTAADHVKILDFGIARAESDKTLTATGLVTGSPAYLAPEVASGHGATAASDVWSLGATTFHVLTGSPPYEVGDNLMGALYRIVHEDPPRVDEPGWLAPLLEGTMTKDVQQRWTMRQVHDFLRAGPSGSAPPPPPREREGSGTQVMAPVPSAPDTPAEPVEPVAEPAADDAQHRRRSLLPLGVVVAVAVLVGLVGWVVLTGGEDDPSARETAGGTSTAASQPTETDREEPSREGMEAFIGDYLATAPSSPDVAFERLTPAFQRASGGYGGYSGYWNTIESAELVEVTADPGALTVAYTVDYELGGGESRTDDVVLRLVFRDGRYLIADET